MTCPYCGGRTLVERSVAECDQVVRMRRCTECYETFYTSETESLSGKDDYYRINHEKYIDKRNLKKADFKKAVVDGIGRGKNFMIVKIETEGSPAPEIIINPSENFDQKTKYYYGAYNDDMELIKAKETGKIINITDVLMTSNLSDLNWFAY